MFGSGTVWLVNIAGARVGQQQQQAIRQATASIDMCSAYDAVQHLPSAFAAWTAAWPLLPNSAQQRAHVLVMLITGSDGCLYGAKFTLLMAVLCLGMLATCWQ
jgi:hypothetical protein